MTDWNSKQYLKFKNERTQPAIDLANRILINNPKKIIDIGCGPGNSTQVLAEKFPNSYILGIDSSENMISSAKKEYPNLSFKVFDASTNLSALDSDFDIVFSNACIQWIPNHDQLLKNMVGILRNTGVLAVQTPMNYKEPIHKIIEKTIRLRKWNDCFPNPRVFFNLTQSDYFDILSELSTDFSIWETIYCHVMKSHKEILEWYRGTGLRPYLNLLDDTKKADFENDIMEGIVQSYPTQKNGEIVFRFPRFFFVANPRS